MTRLWPKSLLGQVLLAVALALLVAQTLSAVLLLRAGDTRRDQAALNAAAFRLVSYNEAERRRLFTRDGGREPRNGGRIRPDRPELGQGGNVDEPPRALRIETAAQNPRAAHEARKGLLEDDLRQILEREGIAVADIIVFQREAMQDPFVRDRPRLMRRLAAVSDNRLTLLVAAIRVDDSQQWQIARAVKPPRQRGALSSILIQTALIYALLVGLHFLLLRRITRPLAALTRRTEAFGHPAGASEPMPAHGPDDIKRLIHAHNAMEARIAGLLDEKDVMLGAIGHDLKTPLAALRVRIESVENAAERDKMARSIEDITHTLDDILSLARVGRASEPPERADLAALVSSVVEEFEDMGKPVLLIQPGKTIRPVHVTWLRRGLRNLIDNALRYAGTARVGMSQDADGVTLWVEDDGPGIAETALSTIMDPFTRGETSRNRQTGGAGLGLTLARAIAEQHGGSLSLTNRLIDGRIGGLRAEIRLPDARL